MVRRLASIGILMLSTVVLGCASAPPRFDASEVTLGVTSNGWFTVPLLLDGTRKQYLLDIGSNVSGLTELELQGFRARKSGAEREVSFINSTDSLEAFDLGSIALGSIAYGGAAWYVLPDLGLLGGPEMDSGIVGLNLFSNQRIFVHGPSRTLLINPDLECSLAQPIRVRGNGVERTLELNSQLRDVIIDSGAARSTVVVDQKQFESLPKLGVRTLDALGIAGAELRGPVEVTIVLDDGEIHQFNAYAGTENRIGNDVLIEIGTFLDLRNFVGALVGSPSSCTPPI